MKYRPIMSENKLQNFTKILSNIARYRQTEKNNIFPKCSSFLMMLMPEYNSEVY